MAYRTPEQAASNMAYLHAPLLNAPIQPLQAVPACAVALTPEPVVARFLEVFQGMQVDRAQEAVQQTSGNHPNVERLVHTETLCYICCSSQQWL